jgi:hypothetical protein
MDSLKLYWHLLGVLPLAASAYDIKPFLLLLFLVRRRCAGIAAEADLPLVGNGDVFSYSEWAARLSATGVTTAMIGRAALIKPWIFTGAWGGFCTRLPRCICLAPRAVQLSWCYTLRVLPASDQVSL